VKMATHRGMLKEVRSGDTLVLLGPQNQMPPAEYSITLSGILAPRIGRKGAMDEPFAWAAREFLRTRYVGKMVDFRIESEWNGREFGSVFCDGNSLASELVAAGLVRVKDKGQGPDFEDLQALQAEAAAAGRGLHTDDQATLSNAVRVVVDSDFDVEDFCNDHKKHTLHAIVERVRDGGCISVHILPEFQYMNVFLSGIMCPRQIPNHETGEIAETQPFYYEAKNVAETLLLNRDVFLTIDQLDKNGHVFGTVLTDQGNVAEEILHRGLGKTIDWSCELSACKTGMRLAERAAREALLGIWKDYVIPANANRKAAGDLTWPARVLEIRSGDTICVQRTGSLEEMTVSLSSIRCPRMGNRQRDEPDTPWAWEAKEFLRGAMIGQQVMVKVDYVRQVGESDRQFVTVTNKQKNVAVMLAKNGLCEIMRHRGDEERSSAYDEIAEAETEAKTKKVRMHGPGSAPVHRNNDMSVSAQKAKTFLPHLQKHGKVRAIVDYVAQGARLRATIPEHAASISFALSGIRCPGTARGDTAAEPFANEAHHFTRLHMMQREVDLEIETCDRGGSFLGSLFMGGDSLAVNLLQNGYAWLSESADRSPYFNQLEAAQNNAKARKVRVWERYDEEAEKRAAEEERALQQKATPSVVRVAAQLVVNGSTWFTHLLGEEAEPLHKLRLRQFANCDFAPPGSNNRYRANQYCSAEYEDGQMYRVKVLRFSDGYYEVQYIDYGNTSWVQEDQMQPWEGGPDVPPRAYECKLAYVQAPKLDEEYGNEAGQTLAEMVLNKELTAQIVARAGETYHLMIFDGNKCINAEMLKSGVVMLTKDAKKSTSKEMEPLFAAAEHAKRSRVNLWRYGDPGSDDEDEKRW